MRVLVLNILIFVMACSSSGVKGNGASTKVNVAADKTSTPII